MSARRRPIDGGGPPAAFRSCGKMALVAALLVGGLAATACARPAAAPRALAPPGAASAWHYEVVPSPGARELSVELRVTSATAHDLEFGGGGEAFAGDVELSSDEGRRTTRTIPRVGRTLDRTTEETWRIPACPTGCRIRYRFRLADAAKVLHEIDSMADYDGAFVGAPGTWLLHPTRALPEEPFRFHVAESEGGAFVTCLRRARDGAPGAYEGRVVDLASAPTSAFGAIRVHAIAVDDAVVTTAIAAGPFHADDAAILRWVRASSRALADYYGRFPLPHSLILVLPTRGDRVRYGQAEGGGGGAVFILLGRDAAPSELADDWVLPHEMVHLASPSLDRRHRWLEEGLATYVEPIARARSSGLSAERVWRWLVEGVPNGLPKRGDAGLDHTPTWGRTYWGGALFCLLADVEIRERTANRRSIDDALRAVLAAGGNIAEWWEIEHMLDVGDRATGLTVLRDLYERMKGDPVDVDLPALWKRLGVVRRGERITFDDNAPLASVRRAMTAREASTARR